MSYTGLPEAVAGFGSANFQPTVSNWHATDALLPLQQGGNTNPADGSGVIQHAVLCWLDARRWDSCFGGVCSGDVWARESDGAHGAYRVKRADGFCACQSRRDRIDIPAYRPGQQHELDRRLATRPEGRAGEPAVSCTSPGARTSDPDFWGNREVTLGGPSGRDPTLDYRLQNVELFRFAFTLDHSFVNRDLIVDAPLSPDSNAVARACGMLGTSARSVSGNIARYTAGRDCSDRCGARCPPITGYSDRAGAWVAGGWAAGEAGEAGEAGGGG